MPTIRKSQKGIEYLIRVLKEKQRVVTRAMFWRIPHANHPPELSLKIGRYKKGTFGRDVLEVSDPKSELTLDEEELTELAAFLTENYEPLKAGETKYVPITEEFESQNLEHIKALFTNPDKAKVLNFVLENELLPDDVIAAVQYRARQRAITEFQDLLTQDVTEHEWQRWFTSNDWVLGSEFVEILEERQIDTENIADYLMQAYDGFLDIIEIKRPGGGLQFWSDRRDHGNIIPSRELVAAIAQSAAYLYEVEREANSVKFLERVGQVPTVKPRCILLFGRSNEWSDEERTAYRILNASYHNLNIMTYDHVLERAKRMLANSPS
jgi:hypothetical protein